jgi:hypothetical protein
MASPQFDGQRKATLLDCMVAVGIQTALQTLYIYSELQNVSVQRRKDSRNISAAAATFSAPTYIRSCRFAHLPKLQLDTILFQIILQNSQPPGGSQHTV